VTVTCVVQARTGSTRLPGKVLADLHGRPMLGFLLDRLARLEVDDLVVATSDLARDDPVAEVARTRGVAVVRGSEADVLDRFLTALDAFPADVVVRVTADCPLSDPAVIRAAIELQAATGADYVSNSLLRTFPVGLDVEVVTAAALRQAATEASDRPEREHVTPFLYRRPERYRLAALRAPERLATRRWTVDTPTDLDRVRTIVAAVDDPIGAPWRSMLAVDAPPPGEGEGSRLVPADAGDAGVLTELTGDAASERLGTADPVAPTSDAMHGPLRSWVVRRDDDLVGWVQVVVSGGVGRCCGLARRGETDDVLGALAAYLRTDFQVRHWDPDPWLTAGLAAPTS
jgi:spore coat polysaccharide biosynthesis protein SpsF